VQIDEKVSNNVSFVLFVVAAGLLLGDRKKKKPDDDQESKENSVQVQEVKEDTSKND
jgi:hypothetical protein